MRVGDTVTVDGVKGRVDLYFVGSNREDETWEELEDRLAQALLDLNLVGLDWSIVRSWNIVADLQFVQIFAIEWS